MSELTEYYSRRAAEYEEIYHRDDPVRQSEQREIAEAIKHAFRGRRVVELACGTGYWTAPLSETARSVVATDFSEEVLAIAKSKSYRCEVRFEICDAYNLPFGEASFEGGLANFWFSHIPKERIPRFLDGFHRALAPGAIVFMADNVFNADVGGELIKDALDENTYRLRFLGDGSRHKVLKNYYSERAIRDILPTNTRFLDLFFGACFWYVCYKPETGA